MPAFLTKEFLGELEKNISARGNVTFYVTKITSLSGKTIYTTDLSQEKPRQTEPPKGRKLSVFKVTAYYYDLIKEIGRYPDWLKEKLIKSKLDNKQRPEEFEFNRKDIEHLKAAAEGIDTILSHFAEIKKPLDSECRKFIDLLAWHREVYFFSFADNTLDDAILIENHTKGYKIDKETLKEAWGDESI